MRHHHRDPAGITLLEVLIAIGILAIGLSSVVALVPAGRSQATRAVILDRASTLAANTLADVATLGLLRDGTLTVPLTSGMVVVIDPAAAAAYLPGSVAGEIRAGGMFSESATPAAPAAAARLMVQGSDDIVAADSPNPDDPPFHLLADGVRAFQGRMTSLAAITPATGAEWEPGRVSVVVFHNRGSDAASHMISGTLTNFALSLAALPADRTFREIVKPGSVIFTQGRFHQIVSANARPGSSASFVTLSTGGALAGTHAVTFLPDSVGLAERVYTPETGGPFAR
jgi:type II secretory pathway pseudopilin PulG